MNRVCLESIDTNKNVIAYTNSISASHSFYIGLNDEPTYARGDWRWADGTTDDTADNWDTGQPDNNNFDDCAVIAHWRSYKWIDLYCSDKFEYICEIA